MTEETLSTQVENSRFLRAVHRQPVGCHAHNG